MRLSIVTLQSCRNHSSAFFTLCTLIVTFITCITLIASITLITMLTERFQCTVLTQRWLVLTHCNARIHAITRITTAAIVRRHTALIITVAAVIVAMLAGTRIIVMQRTCAATTDTTSIAVSTNTTAIDTPLLRRRVAKLLQRTVLAQRRSILTHLNARVNTVARATHITITTVIVTSVTATITAAIASSTTSAANNNDAAGAARSTSTTILLVAIIRVVVAPIAPSSLVTLIGAALTTIARLLLCALATAQHTDATSSSASLCASLSTRSWRQLRVRRILVTHAEVLVVVVAAHDTPLRAALAASSQHIARCTRPFRHTVAALIHCILQLASTPFTALRTLRELTHATDTTNNNALIGAINIVIGINTVTGVLLSSLISTARSHHTNAFASLTSLCTPCASCRSLVHRCTLNARVTAMRAQRRRIAVISVVSTIIMISTVMNNTPLVGDSSAVHRRRHNTSLTLTATHRRQRCHTSVRRTTATVHHHLAVVRIAVRTHIDARHTPTTITFTRRRNVVNAARTHRTHRLF